MHFQIEVLASSHLGALLSLHRGALQNFCTFLKASPCALVPLWILQVHPSGIPALALRASVQQLLSSSILLANITGLMSDSSSSYLDISPPIDIAISLLSPVASPVFLENYECSSTSFKASSL
ncbi:hypothetical protein Acr_13g0006800 [Actinidia rufa]|uniref:Uncharacterized protein n=1 Tax=Actinidia rufa TaxID=165716 RepID=A0A7J0FM88_9ERIC|nr:hypothetical protein Acr_13g0006800 [Actinidia rufa]